MLLSQCSAPPPFPPDVDGDGEVGFGDLLEILSSWGPCPPERPQDVNGDGSVGFQDLLDVLSSRGPVPWDRTSFR
jgi:Ca2+-binding EF-hand superfamily protein